MKDDYKLFLGSLSLFVAAGLGCILLGQTDGAPLGLILASILFGIGIPMSVQAEKYIQAPEEKGGMYFFASLCYGVSAVCICLLLHEFAGPMEACVVASFAAYYASRRLGKWSDVQSDPNVKSGQSSLCFIMAAIALIMSAAAGWFVVGTLSLLGFGVVVSLVVAGVLLWQVIRKNVTTTASS